jgi:hypothetical protein
MSPPIGHVSRFACSYVWLKQSTVGTTTSMLPILPSAANASYILNIGSIILLSVEPAKKCADPGQVSSTKWYSRVHKALFPSLAIRMMLSLKMTNPNRS